MADARLERERDFHNTRFGRESDPREHLDRWYASVRHGAERQDALVLEAAAGADVLEYGCADGSLSLQGLGLPARCRSLTGIDISDVAIAKANHAVSLQSHQNARFLVMDAEAMAFPDASFDLVFGRGILHHLKLESALREISRVLRPDGMAVFSEPMGHNPLINFYRSRTPDLRTEDEHPLRVSDFALARRHFARVDTRYYGLFCVASALVDRNAGGATYQIAKTLDDIVLKAPAIGKLAWHCLIVFHKT